jgi:site-specific DNA-methyltransferase (adenine-specific)
VTFTIHHGDALAVLAGMEAESVDAVITDPPYSSGGMFRGDRTKATGAKYVVDVGQEKHADFAGDSRDQRAFAYWCALWLGECWRVAKPGALIAVFTDWRQLSTVIDQVQAGGWVWRGIVPWNKTEATRPQKGWFRSQCEYLVVGAKGIPALYDQTGKTDAPALPGFFVCPVDRDTVHQTQKPVDLMRWLCQLVPRGGVVLDPFMGSGTTGVGALMEGRRFIGVEMTEHYADHARARLAATAVPGEQRSIEAATGTQGDLFAASPA